MGERAGEPPPHLPCRSPPPHGSAFSARRGRRNSGDSGPLSGARASRIGSGPTQSRWARNGVIDFSLRQRPCEFNLATKGIANVLTNRLSRAIDGYHRSDDDPPALFGDVNNGHSRFGSSNAIFRVGDDPNLSATRLAEYFPGNRAELIWMQAATYGSPALA